MAVDLRHLFRPRSVAVIGASADLDSVSTQPMRFLLDHGYRGILYPINPRYQEVAGFRCYPDVREVPDEVDLAVVGISAARVPGALRQCAEKGVRFAVVFSAGFAETGEEGRALQEEIVAIARRSGMRLVGPNCQGMVNVPDGMWTGIGDPFVLKQLRSGPVSMVSQSGGFGFAAVAIAEEAGVGFRHVVSSGNEADLNTLDFVEFFLRDPETRVVVSFLEGLRDARRLSDISELALELGKPLVIWKVGNTEAGERAAASHTANLVGGAALYPAVFREKGILQITDVYELVDIYRAFEGGRLPSGNRVGIVTISGGGGIMVADHCSANGMEVPPLSESCRARIREVVPGFASLMNPADVTGHVFRDRAKLERPLRVLLEDDNLDSLAVVTASLCGAPAVEAAEEMARAAADTDKPIVVAWSARESLSREALNVLEEARLPHFETPVRAARGLVALNSFATARERLRRDRQDSQGPPWKPPMAAIELLRGFPLRAEQAGILAEYQAKQFLSRCGLPTTREELATRPEEAVAAARRIGYPVVAKVQSPDIPHKTEAGAIQIGLRSEEEVREAYRRLMASAVRYRPGADIHGVLIQEMVEDATEVILGILNDPVFGPTIMFGLGGVFTEVLRDVSFRVAPLGRSSAEEMVREIRGYPVLRGARGRPRSDVEALVETLVRLSGIATSMEADIAELDINPLFVLPEGLGVRVGDALIRRRPIASSSPVPPSRPS